MKPIRGLFKLAVAAGFGAVTYGLMAELNARAMSVPPAWTRHQDKQNPIDEGAQVIIATTSAYGVWSALGKFGGWLARRAQR